MATALKLTFIQLLLILIASSVACQEVFCPSVRLRKSKSDLLTARLIAQANT